MPNYAIDLDDLEIARLKRLKGINKRSDIEQALAQILKHELDKLLDQVDKEKVEHVKH